MAQISENIKEMYSMLETMESMMGTYQQFVEKDITDSIFNKGIVDELGQFKRIQVDSFTAPICNALYLKYGKRDTTQENFPSDPEERFQRIHEELLKVYDACASYYEFLGEREKLLKEVQKATEDYENYISSPEAVALNQKKIQDMKEKLGMMDEDSAEAKELSKRMNVIDNIDNLEFVFSRINTLKDKEIKSIMDSYFDRTRGNYTLSKFKDKAVKLGLKPDIFTKLTSIEENFLGEEYYPYNNLFLFGTVRMVAHADLSNKEDKLFSNVILINLLKLVYNKCTEEEKEKILNIVKSYDDLFKPYEEVFIEKNTTNPNHEYRKQIDKEITEKTLQNIKEMYEEYGLEMPEGKEIPEYIAELKKHRSLLELRDWLKMYNVPYTDEMTLEELMAIKEDFMNPPVEDTEKTTEQEVIELPEDDTVEESVEEDVPQTSFDPTKKEDVEVVDIGEIGMDAVDNE